ncbi:MAG: hypothetical protein CSA62_09915 [Planctomycetota bacterium]|nr:MAG: hypothetical protein CSA62_09915 [Planctomycetota bacterium]
MRFSPSLAALALVFLFLSSAALAERDAMLRVELEPGRQQWVRSPVLVKVTLEGLDAETLRWVDAKSFRLRFDGHDVTGLILSEAARQGGVRFVRAGGAVELRCALPIPKGWHEISAEYRSVHGGGPRFAQRFYVYDPRELRRGLGLAPRPRPVQPLQPGSVTGPPATVQAAPLFLNPRDKAFVKAAQHDLELRWSSNGVGMKLGTVKILLDFKDVTSRFTIERERAIWKRAPLTNGMHSLVAQVADFDGRLRVESSTFIVFDPAERYPWFFPPTAQNSPLAHTHQQFQNYSSSASRAYFHHGIDLRRPSGTRVLACVGGTVSNFYWYGRKPYYFEVEVTDKDGFRWQYHHIDEPKVPAAVRAAAARKGKIAQGTDIGANVHWPTPAYGQRFHHIHLNVIAPDGRYVNPLNLMAPLVDTTPPSILGVWALQQGGTRALDPAQGIGGKLDFVAKAEDKIAQQPYQLSVYKMTWEIKELSNTKSHHLAERVLWQFDSLPGGSNRFAKVWDIHKPRFYDGTRWHNTRGNYRSKDFYYVLTNRFQSGVDDAKGYWDSAEKDWQGKPRFPNGRYRLIVRAFDRNGNMGSKTLDFTLKN